MIKGKENLDFNYWSKHNPNIEITPWERKLLREFFTEDYGMIPDHKLDYQSSQLKLMIDFGRRMSYSLS